MSANADIRYRFLGDSSNLEQAGKEAQAALDATARTATQAGQKVTKSFDDIGESAGRLGSSAKKLRGGLGAISPELATLAGAVDDTADAIEVLSASGAAFGIAAGAIGLTLAGLAAGYYAVTTAIEREAAAHEQEHRLALSLVEVNRSLATAQLDLAHAYGQLGDAQLQQAKNALTAQAAVIDFAESHREEKRALQASIDSAETWTTAYKALPFTVDAAVDAVAEMVFGVEENKAAVDRLNTSEEEHAARQKELRKLLDELADAQETNTIKTRDGTKAIRERNEAQAEWVARVQAELDAGYRKFAKDKQDRADRIQAEIDALANQAALEQRHAEHRAEMERQFQALRAKGISDAIHGAGELGDALKDTGRAGFAIWKASALAQVVFDTAVGVQKAIAEFAAIPPLAAALTATIVASSAVQAGKIAAEQPRFHTGGVNRTDERQATLLKDETVLTARGTETLVAAINRGEWGGGGPALNLSILDHRAYGRFIADEVNAPTRLGNAISAARSVRPGRRVRGAA